MHSNAHSFGQGPYRTAQPPAWNNRIVPTVAAQNNTSVDIDDDDDDEFRRQDLGDDIILELLKNENEFLCSQAARQQEKLQRESSQNAPSPRDIASHASHAPHTRGDENRWATDQRRIGNEKTEGAGSAPGKANGMTLQLHSIAIQPYRPTGQPTHDTLNGNIAKNEQELNEKLQEEIRCLQELVRDKDAEISVVRRNLVRVEHDKDMIIRNKDEALGKAHSERDQLKDEMKRREESLKVDKAFKDGEIDPFNRQRNIYSKRGFGNGTAGGQPFSSPLSSPSPKGKGSIFPTLDTFNEPPPKLRLPQPQPKKFVRSVAVMTDGLPAAIERREAGPVVRVDAMDVDDDGGRGKLRSRRRSKRQMVLGIDERMVLMQCLLADVLPDSLDSQQDHDSKEPDSNRRSIHALTNDRFIEQCLAAGADELPSAELQTRCRRLASATLDCLARVLDVEIGQTIERLMEIAEGFLEVCLEAQAFALLSPVIGVVRMLAASYPTFRALAVKATATRLSPPSRMTVPLVDALMSVLAIYAPPSSTSSGSRSGDQSYERTFVGGKPARERGVALADAVGVLEVLRCLAYGCDRGDVIRFAPILSKHIAFHLLDTGQPHRVVLDTTELLSSIIIDDTLYKLAANPINPPASRQRLSTMEKAIRFLTEQTKGSTVTEALEIRTATLRLVACVCVQGTREVAVVFECAVQALPKLVEALSAELEAATGFGDSSEQSCRFVHDTVRLLHRIFVRHPTLSDQLDGSTARALFVTAMSRLAFRGEEGIGGVAELAHALLESVIPSEVDAVAGLFKTPIV